MSEDGEMMRIDREAQLVAGGSGQRAKQLVGCFDRRPAFFADEMCMGERGELVRGRAVPEVGVAYHAHALKLLEVAVDGGDVHVWGASTHCLSELLCAQVTVGLEQDLEQYPT